MDLNKYEEKQKHVEINTQANKTQQKNSMGVPMENPMQKSKAADAPQDIFAHKEATAAIFDVFAEDARSEREIKREQKSFLKGLAHDEKKTFSLYNSLEGNPTNILKWLKASAAIDGASTSFKNIIASFEKMYKVPADTVETASYELANMAQEYLNTHSQKPSHLYGRQRVTICKEIINHISEFPMQIIWQRTEHKNEDLPDQNPNEGLENTLDMEKPAEQEVRREQLNGVVMEVIKFSEAEMDKMIAHPEEYKDNLAKVERMAAIIKYSQKNDNAFDTEYFKKLNEVPFDILHNRAKLLTESLPKLLRLLSSKDSSKEEIEAARKEYAEEKNKNFIPAQDKRLRDKDIAEKVDGKFAGILSKGSEKLLRKRGEEAYNKVEAAVSKYIKDGTIAMPTVAEALSVLKTGSKEEKYALWMVFAEAEVRGVHFNAEFEAINNILSTTICGCKNEEDKLVQSDDEGAEYAFISASYFSMARQKLYKDVINEIRNTNFPKDATKDQIKAKKNEIMAKYEGSIHVLLSEEMLVNFSKFTDNPVAEDAAMRFKEAFENGPEFFADFVEAAIYEEHYEKAKKTESYTKFYENYENQFKEKAKQAGTEEEVSKELGTYRVEHAVNIAKNQEATIKNSLLSEKKKDKKIKAGNFKKFKKQTYSDEENNAAIERAKQAGVQNVSKSYGKRGEDITKYYIGISEQRKAEYKKVSGDEVYNRNCDYEYVYFYPTEIIKDEDQKERARKLKWNEEYVNFLKEHETNKSPEVEEKGIKLMGERLVEEILGFEITKENILDINWLDKNFEKIMYLGAMSAYIDNFKDAAKSEEGGYADKYIKSLGNLPASDVIIKKTNVFASLSLAVKQFTKLYGVKEVDMARDLKGVVGDSLDDVRWAMADEQAGLSAMELLKTACEAALRDYEAYEKARDEYLKG